MKTVASTPSEEASADSALSMLRREIDGMKWRTLNGLRHLGGESFSPVAATPRDLVWSHDIVKLFRYDAASDDPRDPVLIVHSLVTRAHVFDLQPGSSLVEDFVRSGRTVYLLDWGVPGPTQSHNTIETYCDELIPSAVDAALADSRRDSIDVLGYCLGAVLAAISAAGNVDVPVRNLVMLAPPIDFTVLGVAGNLLQSGRIEPDDLIDETGNVPGSLLVTSFRLAQPTLDVTTTANYWQALPDKRALGSHLAILGWSANHIPFPGTAFRQVVQWFVRERTLESGVIPLAGGDVHLENLKARVLCVTGERDRLVPPTSSEGLERALKGVHVDRLSVNSGHAGLFVGRTARTGAVPQILKWLEEPS